MKHCNYRFLSLIGLCIFILPVTALAQMGQCEPLKDPNSKACKHAYAKHRRDNLNKCLDSVRDGPTRKDINLFGHDFNCKRASILRNGHQVQISGELSHNVRYQPDDQVEYRIVKTFNPNTKVWSIAHPDIRIERGGWGKVGGVAVSGVAAYFGVPIPPEVPNQAIDKLTDAGVGNWREAAYKTVAAIAFKVP